MYPSLVFLVMSVWIGFMASCSSTRSITLRPASAQENDVFTCKGLTRDHHWIDITDEFIPGKDSKIVVVIQLAPDDAQKLVTVEISNPFEAVAFSENHLFPKEKVLGITYEMDRLIANGGEGEWRVFVFSDGLPIGRAIFYVGKKSEKIGEPEGPRYFVVGGESATESDKTPANAPLPSSRMGTMIHEVSPELSISMPGPKPATPETGISTILLTQPKLPAKKP